MGGFMEDKKYDGFSLCHLIDLPKWSFKASFNLPVDTNARVSRVINVQSNLFEVKVVSSSGRTDYSGKVSVKILYVDVDGVFNTLSETTTFNESMFDSAITSDCRVVLTNIQSSNAVEFDERYLKLVCEFNGNAYFNMNIGMSVLNEDIEGVICKKSFLKAMTNIQVVDNSCTVDSEVNIKGRVAKILLCENKACITDVVPFEGYALITGIVSTNILYEEDDEEVVIKCKSEYSQFKTEIELGMCDKSCMIDIESMVDIGHTVTNTELNEDSATVKCEIGIQFEGFVYKEINFEMNEDVYSIDNEISLNTAERTIYHKIPIVSIKDEVNGEVELNANEPLIEDVLGVMGATATLTQSRIEEDTLTLEGLIGATVLYKEESGNILSTYAEIPFVLTHKLEQFGFIACTHFDIVPVSSKVKAKRSSVLDIDFEINVCGHIYIKENRNVLENIKFGKQISYGDIAFQIYIIQPDEDMWRLCKRIRIAPNELLKTNKDLVEPLRAGDKVVVYR